MDQKLKPFSLLRDIYQVLLTRGRTYAAFTKRDQEIIEGEFSKTDQILDPMSGFGSITKFCSQLGLKSYTLEYNLPQYYWQILNHPRYAKEFIATISRLLLLISEFPDTKLRAIASDDWFPEESKILIFKLLDLAHQCVEMEFKKSDENRSYSLSLLLPFLGRLSCSVPSDVVTRVKKGGICVYRNWQVDFVTYLNVLKNYLENQRPNIKSNLHQVLHGDARNFDFPLRKFRGMYTSPPYPNRMDFSSMFKPEHAFLEILARNKSFDINQSVIGSVFVRGKDIKLPKSLTAREFLGRVNQLKNRKPFQIKHDDVYYLPYFKKYFTDLEVAYKNVEKSLNKDFKGFIVVVNNTHRGLVIPVAEVIIEIWKSLGYFVEVYESRELSHVGAKNPRSKGVRALHTEYVIKIWT
jgi:hypothetical protein